MLNDNFYHKFRFYTKILTTIAEPPFNQSTVAIKYSPPIKATNFVVIFILTNNGACAVNILCSNLLGQSCDQHNYVVQYLVVQPNVIMTILKTQTDDTIIQALSEKSILCVLLPLYYISTLSCLQSIIINHKIISEHR